MLYLLRFAIFTAIWVDLCESVEFVAPKKQRTIISSHSSSDDESDVLTPPEHRSVFDIGNDHDLKMFADVMKTELLSLAMTSKQNYNILMGSAHFKREIIRTQQEKMITKLLNSLAPLSKFTQASGVRLEVMRYMKKQPLLVKRSLEYTLEVDSIDSESIFLNPDLNTRFDPMHLRLSEEVEDESFQSLLGAGMGANPIVIHHPFVPLPPLTEMELDDDSTAASMPELEDDSGIGDVAPFIANNNGIVESIPVVDGPAVTPASGDVNTRVRKVSSSSRQELVLDLLELGVGAVMWGGPDHIFGKKYKHAQIVFKEFLDNPKVLVAFARLNHIWLDMIPKEMKESLSFAMECVGSQVCTSHMFYNIPEVFLNPKFMQHAVHYGSTSLLELEFKSLVSTSEPNFSGSKNGESLFRANTYFWKVEDVFRLSMSEAELIVLGAVSSVNAKSCSDNYPYTMAPYELLPGVVLRKEEMCPTDDAMLVRKVYRRIVNMPIRENFPDFHDLFLRDRNFFVNRVSDQMFERGCCELCHAGAPFMYNEDIVHMAVSKWGGSLLCAGPEFKHDVDMVLTAVSNFGPALSFATPKIKANEEVVTAAALNDRESLQYASEKLLNNKAFMMKMVTTINGGVLKYAGIERSNFRGAQKLHFLKDDTELVLAAIASNPYALQFASNRLRDNPSICWQAITVSWGAVKHCSDRLKENVEFMEKVISREAFTLQMVPDSVMLEHPFLVKLALNSNVQTWRFMPKDMLADKDIWKLIIAKRPSLFEHASTELKNDEGFIASMIGPYPNACEILKYSNLRRQMEFLKYILPRNWKCLEYCPSRWKERLKKKFGVGGDSGGELNENDSETNDENDLHPTMASDSSTSDSSSVLVTVLPAPTQEIDDPMLEDDIGGGEVVVGDDY